MIARAPESPLEDRVAELATRVMGRRVRAVEEIPPGLGARRFLRVHLSGVGPPSLIARVESTAPPRPGAPPHEPALEPIRALLEDCGLPVPARYGGDDARGIDLLEDVGDTSLERAARDADPARRRALYGEAVDLIPRLQAVRPVAPARVAAFGRHLDAALIETKARKWLEWTIPFAFGRPATPGEAEATRRAFAVTAEACHSAPARLAHRDFKAANLHLVPTADSGEAHRLVMIDLQGAFMAPPEYDLVCLLRDAHVELTEDEVRAQFDRVRDALPDRVAPDARARRFDLLTVVRVAKDVSHYLDASATRGDDRYLGFVATGLRNLRRAARRAAERDADVGPFADLVEGLPDDLATKASPRASGDPTCAP